MEKVVRKRFLEFMRKTGMSKHEFSRRSGIPRSTIRYIEQTEDYEIGEGNLLKLCRGMEIEPFELFLDRDSPKLAIGEDEVNLLSAYRRLNRTDKNRLEGYLQALADAYDE